MSKDYMKVIVKQPNKSPTIVKIPKRLRDMERLVGGVVEEKRYENVLIIYNQKQNEKGLKVNQIFDDLSMRGTILITGNDEENGDVMSLRKNEIVRFLKKIVFKKRNLENEIE